MYCSSCGSDIGSEPQKYCPYCGLTLQQSIYGAQGTRLAEQKNTSTAPEPSADTSEIVSQAALRLVSKSVPVSSPLFRIACWIAPHLAPKFVSTFSPGSDFSQTHPKTFWLVRFLVISAVVILIASAAWWKWKAGQKPAHSTHGIVTDTRSVPDTSKSRNSSPPHSKPSAPSKPSP